MKTPRMPQNGNLLQGLYSTVKDIVDFLPSLKIKGSKNIAVDESAYGSTIRLIETDKSSGKAVSGGSVSAPSTYNGMWAFSDYYNESKIRYLRIKSGIYNRNGLYIKFTGPAEHPDYFEIPWSRFTATTQTYYVYIYQNWNYQTKQWDLPQLRTIANNVMGLPSQDSVGVMGNTVIEGWALLGWVQPDRKPQWTCMETNLPIMIAAGNCMYESLPT